MFAVDLLTGESVRVAETPAELSGTDFGWTVGSPDGDKALLVWKESDVWLESESSYKRGQITKISVVDFIKHRYYTVGLDTSLITEDTNAFWFDNDTVAVGEDLQLNPDADRKDRNALEYWYYLYTFE